MPLRSVGPRPTPSCHGVVGLTREGESAVPPLRAARADPVLNSAPDQTSCCLLAALRLWAVPEPV